MRDEALGAQLLIGSRRYRGPRLRCKLQHRLSKFKVKFAELPTSDKPARFCSKALPCYVAVRQCWLRWPPSGRLVQTCFARVVYPSLSVVGSPGLPRTSSSSRCATSSARARGGALHVRDGETGRDPWPDLQALGKEERGRDPYLFYEVLCSGPVTGEPHLLQKVFSLPLTKPLNRSAPFDTRATDASYARKTRQDKRERERENVGVGIFARGL